MADIRIKDLTTTASSSASDDFIAIDGTTNGTRKLNAFSPTFGGNATVTGNLTVNTALSVTNGITANEATFTGGYAILRGYGGSADAGSLFLGQSSNSNSILSTSTKIYTAIAGTEISNNVAAGFRVITTTASTTTSTGALVVSGGVGVGGAINVGGLLSASATTSLDGLPTAAIFGGTKRVVIGYNTSSDYGFIASADSGTTWKELHLNPSGGLVKVPSTSASTSTSSGALVVSGGVGVAKSLNVGEAVTVAGGSFAAASFYKSASLGTVLSGATGSSYDLYLTNPAGNYVMQVPTGTRNAEFAATLTTVGAITSGASISTSAPTGGAGAWELGVYSSTAPSATGYVTIEIGGTVYKLLASNV